ncbi:hypothetical protein [Agromyces aerolatus]|uniref:hypothetical protein n=1 Tax=Agromyces sp. LY-1074 TaxID=3074080 RepID=UPI00285B4EA7|nr:MULTISPECIES: hypothetical protein [unclassified Agromyces]MDR5698266.1 hypothetical protein [Agromyces sp. LY-1074]MDR5704560.1 hypothetical protein [Agromyces sp. LY-1358]
MTVVDAQIDTDGFNKLLINRGIPFGPTRIDAHCPTDFPYLDGTQGTPLMNVGRGLIVGAAVGVTVDIDAPATIWEYDSRMDRYLAKGTTLVAWNHWAFADLNVGVMMYCTKSKEKAWAERPR